LLQPVKISVIQVAIKPIQNASGDPAGGSQLIYAVQLLLEAYSEFVLIINIDFKNAFHEIHQKDVVEAI